MRDRPEPGKAITVKQKITAAETALQAEGETQSRKTDRMEMEPAAARIKKDRAMSQTGGLENQGGNGGSAEDNSSSDNGNTDSGNSSEAEAEPQIMDLQET